MTNYEKIKAMSVEEMAEFINTDADDCINCPAFVFCDTVSDGSCHAIIEKWLESEAEEDG